MENYCSKESSVHLAFDEFSRGTRELNKRVKRDEDKVDLAEAEALFRRRKGYWRDDKKEKKA